MRLAPLMIVATLLATAACATLPPNIPTPTPSSVTVDPPASSPAVPPSGPSTPTTSGPSLPTTSGAIDVSTYDVSMFASPSGAIWCAVQADAAWCHFPSDFKGKIPSPSKVCPEEMLDVTGVSVGKKVEYFCSGDPTAFPVLNGGDDSGVAWFKGTGFPTVKRDGFVLATLPYGKKLASGSFVCLSQTTGVTCANTAAGIGFTMAKAGVTFIS